MVCTRLRAKFRHRTTQRFGGDRPRQNKQTLKYLVGILYIFCPVLWTLRPAHQLFSPMHRIVLSRA